MLGERIANLRKAKGVSQEELADVLYTSRQAISKWERGESDPDISRLKDLAIYFNVSIDYLLGYDVEATSVNEFINRLSKKTFDINEDEIRMVVSRNKNNFNLLLYAIDYLCDYYVFNKKNELLELIIDYCQKAILLYQPNNPLNISTNDLNRIIAVNYSLVEKYDLARAHIKKNHLSGCDDLLAECEFELGNYQEANKITSDSFTKAVATIISSNLIQMRLFVKAKEYQEALELDIWSIDFIKSVQKNEAFFLDVIFVLTFLKGCCEKHLKLDYQESLNFLRDNKNKVHGSSIDSDGLKFYNNQKLTFVSAQGDIKKLIYQEIKDLKKTGEEYKEAIELYNEIFVGE